LSVAALRQLRLDPGFDARFAALRTAVCQPYFRPHA
jgi:hypothetical protein